VVAQKANQATHRSSGTMRASLLLALVGSATAFLPPFNLRGNGLGPQQQHMPEQHARSLRPAWGGLRMVEDATAPDAEYVALQMLRSRRCFPLLFLCFFPMCYTLRVCPLWCNSSCALSSTPFPLPMQGLGRSHSHALSQFRHFFSVSLAHAVTCYEHTLILDIETSTVCFFVNLHSSIAHAKSSLCKR